MHIHEEVVAIVNELIETLNERESGYKIAAEHVKDPNIALELTNFVMQSNRFISQLMPFSDESSSQNIGKGPLGTIFQGWMNLKEKMMGYKTDSVLGDCITGEEAAIKIYQAALKDRDLPSGLKNILQKQHGEIKLAQEKIKSLRIKSS
jgi:uncharacterized protein (TIGR02284 family)